MSDACCHTPVATGSAACAVLSAEHRVIVQLLDVVAALAAAPALEAAAAREAVALLRAFADRVHHGKEEDLLFPALEEQHPEFPPVQVMRHEHVEGRAAIAGMDAAIAAGDHGAFGRSAAAYVELLRQHIEKEDHCLFSMAAGMLDAAADSALLARFRAADAARTGDGAPALLLDRAAALVHSRGLVPLAADAALRATILGPGRR